MSKITNLFTHKAKQDAETAFLDLVDKDIQTRPASVTPLSDETFGRIDAIEARAQANRDAERIEG